MDRFIDALAPHVGFSKFARSREREDWCVNLQAEGASAVHAAIDMVLQTSGEDLSKPGARVGVAVGQTSYHGPASTSPGGKAPLGTKAKGLTLEAQYPVPTPFFRKRGEDDATFHARKLFEFESYLDVHAHEIGVLLIEPQACAHACTHAHRYVLLLADSGDHRPRPCHGHPPCCVRTSTRPKSAPSQ